MFILQLPLALTIQMNIKKVVNYMTNFFKIAIQLRVQSALKKNTIVLKTYPIWVPEGTRVLWVMC